MQFKAQEETQPCGQYQRPTGPVLKCTCGSWMHGFCGEDVGEGYGQFSTFASTVGLKSMRTMRKRKRNNTRPSRRIVTSRRSYATWDEGTDYMFEVKKTSKSDSGPCKGDIHMKCEGQGHRGNIMRILAISLSTKLSQSKKEFVRLSTIFYKKVHKL